MEEKRQHESLRDIDEAELAAQRAFRVAVARSARLNDAARQELLKVARKTLETARRRAAEAREIAKR